MNLTGAQVSGMTSMSLASAITWLITFTLGKLAARGYLDASDAPQLALVLVIIGSAAWGAYANRRTSILQKAGNIIGEDGRKTEVLASPELASAVPLPNVRSNADNKVASR